MGQNQWHHVGVGEFTTQFRLYFSCWIGMFTGGTNGILTHGHIGNPQKMRAQVIVDAVGQLLTDALTGEEWKKKKQREENGDQRRGSGRLKTWDLAFMVRFCRKTCERLEMSFEATFCLGLLLWPGTEASPVFKLVGFPSFPSPAKNCLLVSAQIPGVFVDAVLRWAKVWAPQLGYQGGSSH